MEWGDLRVFLAAVRAGSYTRAGRKLGINRTTVGRRINALESALGVALFQETPTGPEPTRTGQLLLTGAADIEARIDTLLRDIRSPEAPYETIRIASSAGIASEFLPELDAFQQVDPHAAIELIGALDPLEAVTQRTADLAIALVRRPPLRLAGTQVALLSQARYAARNGARTRELGWGREIEAAIPGQWTAANPTGEEAEASGATRFNNWLQLKQAVLAGLGQASLWCFAADNEPGLQQLAGPDPRNDSPLWLLYRAKTPPSPRLLQLIAFLDNALRQRLGTTNQSY